MATIAASEARSLFTRMLIDYYAEQPKVFTFLRSFFPTVESFTRYLSIEVSRGTEKVAVDVIRGTEGNRNTFSRSTHKTIDPPLYKEYFNATELDLYDRMFGSTGIEEGVFIAFVQQVAEKLMELQNKIERAYELQIAQVLTTGVVDLINDIDIDFKRKSDSLVDKGSGNYWANSGIDCYADIEAGCNFIRKAGKAQGGVMNVIFGTVAWTNFLKNDVVQNRSDIKNWSLDNVRQPQRDAVGSALHGETTCGSYSVRLWTYPEFYQNSSDVMTPYIPDDKIIILPENPRFKLGFAAVPQLIDLNNPVPKKGAFVITNSRDEDNVVDKYTVQSAGIAIPVAVDQIYTLKVVAG